MLPQEDPMQNLMLLKSYNVPELTKRPVSYSPASFKNAIYNQNPGISVIYKELRSSDEIKAQRHKDEQAFYVNSYRGQGVGTDSAKTSIHTDATSGATRKSR